MSDAAKIAIQQNLVENAKKAFFRQAQLVFIKRVEFVAEVAKLNRLERLMNQEEAVLADMRIDGTVSYTKEGKIVIGEVE